MVDSAKAYSHLEYDGFAVMRFDLRFMKYVPIISLTSGRRLVLISLFEVFEIKCAQKLAQDSEQMMLRPVVIIHLDLQVFHVCISE